MTFVVLSTISDDIRLWHGLLREKAKSIMQRSSGMIRDADALIQHINPACRAAQSYPHLPASRLLLSINDFDLPVSEVLEARERNSKIRRVAKYALLVVLLSVLLLTILPEVIQVCFLL